MCLSCTVVSDIRGPFFGIQLQLVYFQTLVLDISIQVLDINFLVSGVQSQAFDVQPQVFVAHFFENDRFHNLDVQILVF